MAADLLWMFLVFGLIYRLGPNRARKEPWLNWGSIIGAAVWMAATALFGWYVQTFGRYERVYGDLAAVVGFLTWVWISLLILLGGAELNCEIRRVHKK